MAKKNKKRQGQAKPLAAPVSPAIATRVSVVVTGESPKAVSVHSPATTKSRWWSHLFAGWRLIVTIVGLFGGLFGGVGTIYALRPLLSANISTFRSGGQPFPATLSIVNGGQFCAKHVEVSVQPTRVIFQGGDSVVWNQKAFNYRSLATGLGPGDPATLSVGQSVRAFERKNRWVVNVGDMSPSSNNYFVHDGPKTPSIPFSGHAGSVGLTDALRGTTEQAVEFADVRVSVRYSPWILPITLTRDFRLYTSCEKGVCSWIPTNPYDPMLVNRPQSFGLEISDESLANKPLAW